MTDTSGPQTAARLLRSLLQEGLREGYRHARKLRHGANPIPRAYCLAMQAMHALAVPTRARVLSVIAMLERATSQDRAAALTLCRMWVWQANARREGLSTETGQPLAPSERLLLDAMRDK